MDDETATLWPPRDLLRQGVLWPEEQAIERAKAYEIAKRWKERFCRAHPVMTEGRGERREGE